MRIIAMIKRISMQMLRDKRTLALLFFAPLLILTLMYFLFNGNDVDPKLGVHNVEEQVIKGLEKASIDVKEYETVSKNMVVEKNLDGLLQINDGKWTLILQNDDPSVAKALQMKVKQVISSQAQAQIMGGNLVKMPQQPTFDVKYEYGDKDTEFFDVLSPILISFFVFFFVFLISGIGLLRERTTGTLDRLISTPIRRYEIITGYLVGYGIFAVIQTVIVVLYAVNVLDIVMVGSIWNVILVNLIVAFVALSLGILLSTFASSEFQMMQFIPIVVIPQVFFAGIFPTDSMADWMVMIGKVMPIYYAADAMKGIMYKGEGLGEIGSDIAVLLFFAIVFIILNIFALKKYRKL
ncbi:ABC transporter permease [Bacillus massiliigorillae]|uniref:ABC transporter permease n=1 Tax=Bacillus massiliigorillae TaxID=1243664 RepID=UPI0003A97898|nr:ABC transporter permease [Bacillus massiliigorillae]